MLKDHSNQNIIDINVIKVLISDFWHVLLFPKDFQTRGSSNIVSKLIDGYAVFFDKYFVNEELLKFYAEVKKKQELQLAIYSSGTLFKKPELQPLLTPVFDQTYSSIDIRFEKNNPESYRFLAKELKVKTSEILFVDDSPNNIEVAKEAGVVTVHYHDNGQVMSEISKTLNL